MLVLQGKYNYAEIFTDVVDEASISQVMTLLNQEFISGSKIRLMPDIHAGAGCTIGTTMTIKDKIVPNLVGVDVSCGMLTAELRTKDIDLERLDDVIRSRIPSGFNIREKQSEWAKSVPLSELKCYKHINEDRAKRSLGTLGGGNHFIEVDKDDDGTLYLVIHTGSRHLGLEMATYYQKSAYEQLNGSTREDEIALIQKLKAEGKQREIEKQLKILKNVKRTNIPRELAYVEGQLFDDYIHDMEIIQKFASASRNAILWEIAEYVGFGVSSVFETLHNYIDVENMILRKGAVSAQKDEVLLIPINMRDGSLICVGKGNGDWNYSAPHGAGRLMSRSQAKQKFTVEEFEMEMEGIYTTSVGTSTLDECPMAYKRMEDIVNNIGDTVKIEKVIKPIYNFKAGDV